MLLAECSAVTPESVHRNAGDAIRKKYEAMWARGAGRGVAQMRRPQFPPAARVVSAPVGDGEALPAPARGAWQPLCAPMPCSVTLSVPDRCRCALVARLKMQLEARGLDPGWVLQHVPLSAMAPE